MIVATAGHVDHGKTSLIRALTGVDTDRLDEERRRGMSIDLGFAYADLGGDLPAGFVDVPGHERFARNMLAGLAAIDVALLVIAADDGPMPQTLEHLAILELLGVDRAVVALTKVDRVPASRRDAVADEIRRLLAPTRLREAPIHPVVATTGDGVPALRARLAEIERTCAVRADAGAFRLAVDRSFTLSGAGLVVTGAVLAGSARVGDALIVSPQGAEVRVRAIHAQNRSADAVHSGQRCALNIAGADLKRLDVGRGSWLVAPEAHAPTERLDVRIDVLGSEQRPLADGVVVRLHLGTAALEARVAILGARSIPPGGRGAAQLVLAEPVAAIRGERFVLRDPSARRTIGGGAVIDPFGAARGRSRPERLAELEAMDSPSPEQALERLLDLRPTGVRLRRFDTSWNLAPREAERLRGTVAMQAIADGGDTLALAPRHWQALCGRIVEALARHHERQPDSVGLAEAKLADDAGLRREMALARALLRSLLSGQQVVRDGLSLRLPGHRPRLADADAALLERVAPMLRESGLRPPIVGELAQRFGVERAALAEDLRRLSLAGHLVQVAGNRFFLPETVVELGRIAARLAGESADGSFDAAQYRDRSGIGRNLTIEVLEFLDRIGVTRYAGERRTMRVPDPASPK